MGAFKHVFTSALVVTGLVLPPVAAAQADAAIRPVKPCGELVAVPAAHVTSASVVPASGGGCGGFCGTYFLSPFPDCKPRPNIEAHG
jgi:hypothetical protein